MGRIHIIGAGPVGLLLTSILQSSEGPPVRLYERRREYTRTRMVSIAPYLISDSVEAYHADSVDGESVDAIFDESELKAFLAFRQAMPPDLFRLLKQWSLGFCPLNAIEQSLSSLIDSREYSNVERAEAVVGAEDAMAMLESGDLLIDCSGARSVMRDHLVATSNGDAKGQNTQRFRLEYALVITFLYGQRYNCNEYCKYYKNIGNPSYKFIPAVHRTYYDGAISHVTGIISISEKLYEAMPRQFDGEWLRNNFPDVAESMDRFIDKVKQETHGEILGDLSIVRIPLDLYRARNATSLRCRNVDGHPLAGTPVFLLGDSAVGSPYFQSISLGFESAMYLASLIGQRSLPLEEMMALYESHVYRQWMRVYMRTRMIKHNKDLLESVDDKMELLAKLHIY
jgi:2-polyprenyl-6-methoxyphenol hydroxylase-like FAD-dependent oxidoreductase